MKSTKHAGYTDPHDLPTLAISVQPRLVIDGKTVDHPVTATIEHAEILLARLDGPALAAVMEGGYDTHDLFDDAVRAGLIFDNIETASDADPETVFEARPESGWDGPLRCDVVDVLGKATQGDGSALARLAEAELDPCAQYTVHEGELVDANQLVLDGLLDADGTSWLRLADIELDDDDVEPDEEDRDAVLATFLGHFVKVFPEPGADGTHAFRIIEKEDGLYAAEAGSYPRAFDAKAAAKGLVLVIHQAGTNPPLGGATVRGIGTIEHMETIAPGIDAMHLEGGGTALKLAAGASTMTPFAAANPGGWYFGENKAEVARHFLSRPDAATGLWGQLEPYAAGPA
ncbi:hypothetical protein ACX8Z9_04645 [Arthrobacter halodurans]|uniref:Uncharacterized protein n=1 Tax=Arthrobacter halodurans TaxID=516699 RepID=A0ABV4UPW5_9MICC